MQNKEQFSASLADSIDKLFTSVEVSRNGILTLHNETYPAFSAVSGFPGEHAQANLFNALVSWIYSKFYCNPEAALLFNPPDTDLTDSFLKACGGHDYETGYWEELDRNDSHILVASGDALYLARPDELSACWESPRFYRMYRKSHSVEEQAGYFHAFGLEVPDRYDMLAGVRMYLALTPSEAPEVCRELISRLNSMLVAFTLKAPRQSCMYGRCDAGVLYLPRSQARCGVVTTLEVARQFKLSLGSPRFTKELADGISIADCPPGGESFGMHRSRLLAHSILYHEAGDKNRLKASDVAAAVFIANGVSPLHPWLAPGNTDIELDSSKSWIFSASAHQHDIRLCAADRIGRKLVRDAVLSDNIACWIGWGIGSSGIGPKTAITTTGPDLYSGTAGIAIFLARLAEATGESVYAKMSLCAIRHSVTRISDIHEPNGYAGLLGVAFAARQVANVLSNDEASSLSAISFREWVNRCELADHSSPEDILHGVAGSICLLLHLQQADGLDRAVSLGSSMLGRAINCGSSITWKRDMNISTAPLHGFAHGNSGIAYALSSLAEQTGSEEFKLAAHKALAYETNSFSYETGDVPDFRINKYSKHHDVSEEMADSMIAWCNGSAGVLLAALAITGKGWLPMSRAVESVANKIYYDLRKEQPDCSLCHGIMGLVEILSQASILLNRPELAGATDDAVANVLDRFSTASWPCGLLPQRESLGLFLGVSGIGYSLLRLGNADIQSILAI
ncbi:MAG: lanthionine synthetase LanC family protein [Cyanobacteriota bacterium]|jgi:hypothetical protein